MSTSQTNNAVDMSMSYNDITLDFWRPGETELNYNCRYTSCLDDPHFQKTMEDADSICQSEQYRDNPEGATTAVSELLSQANKESVRRWEQQEREGSLHSASKQLRFHLLPLQNSHDRCKALQASPGSNQQCQYGRFHISRTVTRSLKESAGKLFPDEEQFRAASPELDNKIYHNTGFVEAWETGDSGLAARVPVNWDWPIEDTTIELPPVLSAIDFRVRLSNRRAYPLLQANSHLQEFLQQCSNLSRSELADQDPTACREQVSRLRDQANIKLDEEWREQVRNHRVTYGRPVIELHQEMDNTESPSHLQIVLAQHLLDGSGSDVS